MAINMKKVLVGGLVGGIVLNILDFVTYGYIVGDRLKAETNAFKAGLGDSMATMSTTNIVTYAVVDFVIALVIVYVYAAVRPRLGPGPMTAIKVALIFWIFGLFMQSSYLTMGIMSSGLFATVAIIWLVELAITAYLGARLYTEEAATI